MFKQALFQVHWALGITAGVLLAVVGLTGAMMSFEGEIMMALNRHPGAVVERAAPRLTVPELIARVEGELPGSATLHGLIVESDPTRLSRAQYWSRADGKYYDERTQHERYIDPYDGRLLSDPVGRNFFRDVRSIHRWFLLPDRVGGPGENEMGPGRWVTMVTSVSLIFFALSGLYLRWPRQPLDWRAWFRLDFRMTGRNLCRSLHAVVGGWVLAFYLLSAVTGLWWSFGEPTSWYRSATSMVLTGRDYKVGDGDGGFPLPHDFGPAWAALQASNPGTYEWIWAEVRDSGGPVRFRVMPFGAAHERAWNTVKVDGATGKLLSKSRYGLSGGKPAPLGDAIMTNMIVIHKGSYFGLPGRVLLMVSSAALPLFTVTGWLLYLGRREKKGALRAIRATEPVAQGDGSLLIIYASQTRVAEGLARQTAAAFSAAWRPADLVPIEKLTPAALMQAKTALFVVSTYGDGEPPDTARGFARRHLVSPLTLNGLSYAVLALGDREYPLFCSFGQRIDQWLQASGARRMFDTLEVDGAQDAPIEAWRQSIATLGAASDAVGIEAAVYEPWRLVERRLLNPGSPGAPAFHIALEPLDADLSWEAGDVAVIVPGRAPIDEGAKGPLREYSIASTPAAARIEFIVRQVRKEDGQLGVGSGWLTEHAVVGQEMALRVRENPAFRATGDGRPAILIGNGTGLAGLLAHIRQGTERNAGPMWLMFGERSRGHDRFHGEELDGHLAAGALTRLDCVFSRDQGDGRYVQDLILEAREELHRWVAKGAAIYVCGSLVGMAPAVDLRLREVLGDQRVDELADAGLYRRDIY